MGLTETVEHRPPRCERVGLGGQSRDAVDGDGVDTRQRLAALGGQLRSGRRVLVVAQDLPGDRLALDAFDNEALVVFGHDAGHGHAGLGGGTEQRRLGHGPGRPAGAPRVGPHDERLGGAVGMHEIDGPHGAGGARREATHVLEPHSVAEESSDPGFIHDVRLSR